jgi:small nuclear ribonucleoprotein (snRNP)-like protein
MPQIIIELKEYEEMKTRLKHFEEKFNEMLETAVKQDIELEAVRHTAFLPIRIQYISPDNIDVSVDTNVKVMGFMGGSSSSYWAIKDIISAIKSNILENNKTWLETQEQKIKKSEPVSYWKNVIDRISNK